MVTGNVFFELIKKGIINKERLKYCHNMLFGIGEGVDDNEHLDKAVMCMEGIKYEYL